MGGSFTVLSHTADTGIDVRADSLGELFEWACVGMFSLMYELDAITAAQSIIVEAEAGAVEELLVDTLADLLYLSEAGDVIPCTFEVERISPTDLRQTVGTAPLEPAHLHGPPIKAVTYHELAVTQHSDGTWTARVIFDV